MPTLADFSFSRSEDGSINIALAPPTAVGGWPVEFRVTKRFGGESGLIVKNLSSGFNAVSGVTILNSGAGQFRVALNSPDTSGLDYGAYAYRFMRNTSGSITVMTEGFLTLLP